MLPSTVDMAEIAAMANEQQAEESAAAQSLDIPDIGGSPKSSKERSSRKKKASRAHRRSQALNSHDSSSNLDFLNELEIPEKKNSTRGLRNRANMMPASYEQPAWMNYKGRGGDGQKKSKRESKRGDRSPVGRGSPKRINSLVGGSTESKVGTPREQLQSPLSAGAGAADSSPRRGSSRSSSRSPKKSGRAAGSPINESMPPAASGSVTPRGSTPTREGSSSTRSKKTRRKHKEKVKSSSSQTLPKKAAAAFPSINGTRSVASLMQNPKTQQRSLDLTMRAVGVKKKQHEKPVSERRKLADRSLTAKGDAFLTQLSSPSRTRAKPVKTGFT
jgi:hypothetical protein